MYTNTTRTALGEFSEQQYSLSPSYQAARLLVYNNFTTSFEQLLDKDNSFAIHQQNIQSLAIEMYKVANGLSTNLFSEIFTKNEATKHFRSKSDFRIPKVRTELYGKCTFRYLGPVIWNTVPLQKI